MPGNSNKPLKTGKSRVFLIEGGARPDHTAEYLPGLRASGLAQPFGDITKIEMPDPDNYDTFIQVDSIRGAMERATTTLIGHFPIEVKSRMLELARKGCSFDVHVHLGECTDPSNFNVFSKGMVFEDTYFTNHATDDLGALDSGARAVVNETGSISSRDYYEALPLSIAKRADDIITVQLLDVTVVDALSCGACGTESDGCKVIFATSKAAGGSPTTPPDILFSIDGGANWFAHDVDTLTTTSDAVAVFGLGDYVVVLSNILATYGLYYATIQNFKDGIDPAFTRVTTGFNTNGLPTDGWSLGRKAFIVGTKGYVYYTEDPTSGVTILDAGVATIANLLHVHAIDSYNALAVGNDGSVIFTRDRVSWSAAPSNPVGIGTNLTSCWMKDLNTWIVTTSAGAMYYTINAGKSWVAKSLPGTAPSKLTDIAFSTSSVGYVSGVVSSKGRMYRTFDGGASWIVLPESSGTFPNCQEISAVAACEYNPNLVVGVGLGVSTDGVLVVGKV